MRNKAASVLMLVSITMATLCLTSPSVTPVSACSLASPVAPWLQVVLDHGLATLTSDCKLVWQSGVVTDLNGNMVSSPAELFVQRYGVAFFGLGVVLFVVGAWLAYRASGLRGKRERNEPIP